MLSHSTASLWQMPLGRTGSARAGGGGVPVQTLRLRRGSASSLAPRLPLADQSRAGQWVPRDGAEMRQLRPCGSAVYLHATRTPSVGLRKSKSPRPSPAVSFPSPAGTTGSPPVLPAPHASHSQQARAEICSLSTAGTPFPFPFPFPG